MKPDSEKLRQGDKILVELYEFAFDVDKLRFFMTFDESTREIAKSVNRNMVLLYVANGTDYRCLESFPDHGAKSGVIQNADQFPAYKSAEVDPIMQAFLAFSRERDQRISDLTVVDGDHEIEGRSVVVMQQQYDGATSSGLQYWIDPSREYVVVRNLLMTGDSRVGSQTDIEYEQHESGTWVPVKWTKTDFDSSGDLRRSYEFQVVDYQINPQLPNSLFELEFEPGVEVLDKRNGLNKANIWTVKSDGTKIIRRGVDPDKKADLHRGSATALILGNLAIMLFLCFIILCRSRVKKTEK